MDRLMIGKHAVGPGEKVLIIAEAGINHDGDVARAHELVDAAAGAGADCIKFQTHLAEAEMLNVSDTAVYLSESLFQLIRRMEFTLDQHVALKEHAERRGITFLSTPFSREAVDLLEKVGVKAYKIGSGELTNLPLLDHVARCGKPLIVSTGMSDLAEVDATVKLLRCRKARVGGTAARPTICRARPSRWGPGGPSGPSRSAGSGGARISRHRWSPTSWR